MSVKIMSLIWHNATDLAGGELLVMLALADWSDDHGKCWPSVPAIAHKSRLSERQVQRILRRLVAAGYLEFEEGRGRNHTNSYLIKVSLCHPLEKVTSEEKVTSATEKVTSTTLKGDIAMSPEPSLTIIKPSERARARALPKTKVPEPFEITHAMKQWAETGAPGINLQTETERFVDYWKAKGIGNVDWIATWRNWMRKAVEYASERGGYTNGNKAHGYVQTPGGISRLRLAGEDKQAEGLRRRAEALEKLQATKGHPPG